MAEQYKGDDMGKVYFIGAGPGDPELITLKGRRILDEAQVVIYAGSLVNPALLDGLKADIYNSASMSLEEIIELMKKAVKEGKTVARLHTGDTTFYSAVTEQIDELKKLGIDYEIVPGVTSAAAATAALGQELTIPEISQTVIFTRQAGKTPVPERERLERLATHRCSMVIFLSISMIDRVMEELRKGGYPEETPVAVVYKASWPEERIVRGTIRDIAEKVKAEGITKTALIIVGDSLKASEESLGKKSRLYDRDFQHEYRRSSHGQRSKGILWVVGIGPGGKEHMTSAALAALNRAELVVGYTRYIDLIRDLIQGREIFETGMTKEIDRCRHAIEEAMNGKNVALVCSGDPGVYAMAGLVYELLRTENIAELQVEVIPGIPALSACASVLGAPLMHDFASISLSDRLTPWEVIERRLHAAASSDFVIVIYNPRSRGRKDHLRRAVEIISSYRDGSTPLGVVKAATRQGEEWFITTLSEVPYEKVDMNTTLIIGNSSTYVWQNRMITPRGYEEKYDLKAST